MEQTIYIDFKEDGEAVDVYSVKLASANPSDAYGILDMTTQTAAVPYGTEIASDPTGTYSYTLSVENGHSYFVSWEIVANAGEAATYRTDQIGPFFSVNNTDIRAVASYSGHFVQEQLATLMLKITTFEGLAQNAGTISIAIYDMNGIQVTLDDDVPENVATGYYVYDWNIPTDQTVGEYTVVWSYTADDVEKAEIQKVIVADKDSTTAIYSGRTVAFRMILEYYLACAQNIPIYYEQAKPSRDNKKYRFTFPRWNQSADVVIYKNGNVVNSGAEVDFFQGTVTFDDTLAAQETVHADYNFRWFTDEELDWYLNAALESMNIYPPHTSYTLETVIDRYIPMVLYGAAKDAIRKLMMCIQFQQPAQVFGGPEGAQNAFQGFDTIKQNYEKDWDKLTEQKKLGPYPSSRAVVVPEYTLPGGRSRWFRMLFKG